MKREQGFTLVEIAIVLVIIGLLLGGILKGQEMITQAKIKNVIADMSGVSAAMYGYQDRYKALPGDDKLAGGTGGRWSSTSAGNGDGIVNGKWTEASTEAIRFWEHLRLSGFISGSGATNPFNAVSGKLGVQTGGGPAPAATTVGTILQETSGSGTAFGGLVLCSGNLPDKIAISVDSQMDDGVGNKGSVRGMVQSAPNPDTIAATASTYTEDGVSTYVVCRQL
jgi:prepilin-type N-terminal cleavage/methylation domain-containing protein